jgi:hypothetical protein
MTPTLTSPPLIDSPFTTRTPSVQRHSISRRARLATAAVAALTASAGLNACSTPPGPSSCPKFDNEGSNNNVVILIDGSESVANTESSARNKLGQLLNLAGDDGPLMTIGTFGGSDAEVNFSSCVNNVHFRPNFNQPGRRKEKIADLVAMTLTDTAQLPGNFESTDLVAALRAGGEKLTTSAAAPRHLIVLTDGVPTAGCAALPESADPTDTALVAGLVQRCQSLGTLPNLDGITVSIIGVGRSATSFTSESVELLTSLNQKLCDATGGTCHVLIDVPASL